MRSHLAAINDSVKSQGGRTAGYDGVYTSTKLEACLKYSRPFADDNYRCVFLCEGELSARIKKKKRHVQIYPSDHIRLVGLYVLTGSPVQKGENPCWETRTAP